MALLALLQVFVTGVAARGLGRRMLAGRWRFEQPALQVATEAGFGLLVLTFALYGLTMAGFWLPVPGLVGRGLLWALFVGLATVALLEGPRLIAGARALRDSARADTWLQVGVAAGLLYFAWMALGATLPPISLDEMVYHLEVPRQILSVGYLPVFTDNVLAYYPMGPQMLFLFGLGIAGETAARLFHVLYGVLVALAMFGFARPLIGSRGAVVGVATFLTIPTIMVIGHWAYIDLNFTLYGFLALVGVMGYIRVRQESERAALPYAVFAGLMAGAAWTVKYTALQLVLLLILMVLFEHLRTRPRDAPYGVVAIGGIAFALFVPYLVRTWSITGWPLFPFQIGPFELTGVVNWSAHQADLALAWQRQYGAGYERTLLERLMSGVWVFTSANDNYTAYDGIVGSAFLLAPLALLARKRPAETRLLAMFALMFLLYWTTTTTQVRFLLPGLPAAALLLGVATTDRARTLMTVALVGLIGLNVFIGLDSVLKTGATGYWAGAVSRDEFLASRLPPYPIYQEANRRLGPGDRLYLVNMRTWGYLLDLRGRGEMDPFPNGWRSDYTFEHYHLEGALRASQRPADLDSFFDGMGITHLMIDEGITLSPDALEARERRLLAGYLRTRATQLFRNPRDPQQSLWLLQPPETPVPATEAQAPRLEAPRPDARAPRP